MSAVHGPYQVIDDDLERYTTLDDLDLGAWYIVINGSMQFCGTKEAGEFMVGSLTKFEQTLHGDPHWMKEPDPF